MDPERKAIPLFVVVLVFVLSSCAQTAGTLEYQDSLRPTIEGSTAETLEPSQTFATTDIVFTASRQDFGRPRAFGIAVADVELDGDNDVLIANYVGHSRLWLNDGNGEFSDSRQVFGPVNAQRAHAVAMEDLDGDAYPDVFVVYHQSPSRVFFNDGTGGFTDSQQDIGSVSDIPQSIVLGDIENDGDVDVFLIFARSANRLWINDGNGFFVRSETEFGESTSPAMLLDDFNGDGSLDLLYCYLDRLNQVWINDGLGDFTPTGQEIGQQGACGMDSGDIDGDGDQDIAIADGSGVGIWLNTSNTGTFVEATPLNNPGIMRIKLLDADLDGDSDLLAAHLEDGNRLWLNEGSRFAPTDQLLGPDWASAFAVAKLDADDDYDVVLGYDAGVDGVALYFNE